MDWLHLGETHLSLSAGSGSASYHTVADSNGDWTVRLNLSFSEGDVGCHTAEHNTESTDTAERQQRNPFEEPSVMNFTVAGLTGQPWTARDVLLGDVFFCSGYVECIVSEYVGSAVSIFPTVLTTCTSW